MAYDFTIGTISKKLPNYSAPALMTAPVGPQPMVGPVQPAPTPTPTPKPASPSATTAVPPPAPAPAPNPTLSSPAAQTFINTQTSAPSPTPTPAPAPNTGSTFYGASTSNSAPQSAYLDFLNKQFNAKEIEQAAKDKTELTKRTNEELLRARKEEDTIRANEKGQLASGQTFDLNEAARKSNQSLADLALAKGAATEIYQQMLDAGKTANDAQIAAQAAFDTKASKILADTAPALVAQLKSLPDKISQDNFIRQKASELGVSIDQLNSALQKELTGGASDVASIQEYNLAKSQGFTGTYQQWVDRVKPGSGTGSTTATLKADINADVTGIINKWQNGLQGTDGKVSPETYKAEKANWIRAYAGDVADPSKQFDDLFSFYANQSYYNWQQDYGIK